MSGLDKKIREYDVCELILLKRLLNRVMSQCKSNIIDTLDKIIDIMEDNENNDSTNVIDFTSFNIVYLISVSTMLLYSFVKLYGKAYGEITENVKELILQWRELYNVLSDIKYESITCWSMMFDELYLLERARDYLDDVFKS